MNDDTDSDIEITINHELDRRKLDNVLGDGAISLQEIATAPIIDMETGEEM